MVSVRHAEKVDVRFSAQIAFTQSLVKHSWVKDVIQMIFRHTPERVVNRPRMTVKVIAPHRLVHLVSPDTRKLPRDPVAAGRFHKPTTDDVRVKA